MCESQFFSNRMGNLLSRSGRWPFAPKINLLLSDSVIHVLLDHVHCNLHHHFSDHQHEESLQQVHHCDAYHLCLYVDHQPVIIKVAEMIHRYTAL